tara:strand:- start:962 stop:2050 length:1089 start_codon:yes stop_codon:yes gene_type:complete
MNKVLFNYLFTGYSKTVFKVIMIAYCFGLILNLFEEIEFFKNSSSSILIPMSLTALYVPNIVIKLMPFIIFIASMWFLLRLRDSSDLLSMKVFGFSNFKIFFILAAVSFMFGWLILFAINPITSTMVKYYEQTKSNFSRDIDHLISVNKNGLWIKENTIDGYRIITADATKDNIIKNVIIFNLNKENNLVSKIHSKEANISKNEWDLMDVKIHEFKDGISDHSSLDKFSIVSKYNYHKISVLFKNFDTMSFLELLLNYNDLQKKGYNKSYLDQNLNSMLSMPFFLFIMTSLASILAMSTLKKSNNFLFIVVGLITCVGVYYFKDLSLALGQTNRISLSLAVWIPVIAIGLFSSIGVLQINEK